MRVYGRRLRVALPLLARKPEGRRVRRARRMVQEVVRSAAASRDRDVMLGLLREDLARGGRQTNMVGHLHARLNGSTQRARKRLTVLILAAEVQRLDAALRSAGERALPLDDALRRIEKLRKDLRKDQRKKLKKLGRRFNPVRLHALRRSFRHLRYTAELQDQLTGRKTGAVDILKHMQTRLGRVHDRWVLAAWFAAQGEPGPGRRQPALQREARRWSRHALSDARRQHRKWLEEHPAQQLESAYWSLSAVGPQGPRGNPQDGR